MVQPVNAPLTPSSELKIGEWFIVLRRAPSRDGIVNERCLATLVEIRSDQEAIEAASVENTFEQVHSQLLLYISCCTVLRIKDIRVVIIPEKFCSASCGCDYEFATKKSIIIVVIRSP